jgi:hypothetical protein
MGNIVGNKKGYLTFKGASRQVDNQSSKVFDQLMQAYNNREYNKVKWDYHFSSIRKVEKVD